MQLCLPALHLPSLSIFSFNMHELEPIHFESEWDEPSTGFLWLLLRTMILDGLIIVLFLFSLEIYLRLDRRFSYLVANKEYSLGHKLMRNSRGFRGPEYPADLLESDQVKRILVIGDSTSFGSGVAWDSTYAAQLDGLFGDKYKVLNAGNQGDSIGRAIRVITEEYAYIKPAWVILGFSPSMVADGFNDLQRGQIEVDEKAESSGIKLIRIHDHLLQYCRVYAFLNREVRVVLYRLGVMVENLDKVRGAIFAYGFDTAGFSPELFASLERTYALIDEKLIELQAKLQIQGARLLVVGIPSRFMISDLPADNLRSVDKTKIRINPMDRLATVKGIEFLNLEPVLRQQRVAMLKSGLWDPLYIRDDYAHLNELGHRLAAEAIHTAITNMEKLDSGR